jgi:hypothetical protein
MRLSVAARYFDKTLCTDAFNPGTTFYGQLDLYDDSKREGPTTLRRVLSLAADVAIPARRVITIGAEQWIVGSSESDYWRGEVLRTKYILHRATGGASLQTIAQALGTAGTVSSYAARFWLKDLKEPEISSKLLSFYTIFLPVGETVTLNGIIQVGGRAHFVRNSYQSGAGFLAAETDELPLDALTTGVYTPQVYSGAADTRTPGIGVALNLLKLRFQDYFTYANEAEPRYVEGDLRVMIRKADVTTAKVNDQITFGGEAREILAVADEGACWGLHVRLAAG